MEIELWENNDMRPEFLPDQIILLSFSGQSFFFSFVNIMNWNNVGFDVVVTKLMNGGVDTLHFVKMYVVKEHWKSKLLLLMRVTFYTNTILLLFTIFYYYSWWCETEFTWYCGHFWPIVPAPDDRWGWLWSSWWNEDWQGKPKEKTWPSATFSATYPTRPDPGSNKDLSYGVAYFILDFELDNRIFMLLYRYEHQNDGCNRYSPYNRI
jgi:hypothetical protein